MISGCESCCPFSVWCIGVNQAQPVLAAYEFRQSKVDDVMVCIQYQQQRHVGCRSLDPAGLRAAIDQHTETAHVAIIPVSIGHFSARRIYPGNIFHIQLFIAFSSQKTSTSKYWKRPPKHRELSQEAGQCATVVIDFLP